MRVLDHEPQSWFLLEGDGRLYLDAHCSHSFVDYDFVMALNDDELAMFGKKGRGYLQRLRDDIQYSAPGVAISTSPYKRRNLFHGVGAEVREAVKAFHQSTPA